MTVEFYSRKINDFYSPLKLIMKIMKQNYMKDAKHLA